MFGFVHVVPGMLAHDARLKRDRVICGRVRRGLVLRVDSRKIFAIISDEVFFGHGGRALSSATSSPFFHSLQHRRKVEETQERGPLEDPHIIP